MGDDDDRVGYGRPPKHTRFQKGQSGNPRGRPKKRPSFAEDLRAEFAETVPMKENGRLKRISKQRALIKKITAAAIGTDIRALNALMPLVRMMEAGEESATQPIADIGDLDLLEKFVKQQRERQARKSEDRAKKAE